MTHSNKYEMKLMDKYDVKRVTNIQENKEVLTTSAQIKQDVNYIT